MENLRPKYRIKSVAVEYVDGHLEADCILHKSCLPVMPLWAESEASRISYIPTIEKWRSWSFTTSHGKYTTGLGLG